MLMEAAFAVLLARYSRQEDILLGTPIANRPHAMLEGLIGFFVNTLVLRNQVEPTTRFTTFLQQTKQVMPLKLRMPKPNSKFLNSAETNYTTTWRRSSRMPKPRAKAGSSMPPDSRKNRRSTGSQT